MTSCSGNIDYGNVAPGNARMFVTAKGSNSKTVTRFIADPDDHDYLPTNGDSKSWILGEGKDIGDLVSLELNLLSDHEGAAQQYISLFCLTSITWKSNKPQHATNELVMGEEYVGDGVMLFASNTEIGSVHQPNGFGAYTKHPAQLAL